MCLCPAILVAAFPSKAFPCEAHPLGGPAPARPGPHAAGVPSPRLPLNAFPHGQPVALKSCSWSVNAPSWALPHMVQWRPVIAGTPDPYCKRDSTEPQQALLWPLGEQRVHSSLESEGSSVRCKHPESLDQAQCEIQAPETSERHKRHCDCHQLGDVLMMCPVPPQRTEESLCPTAGHTCPAAHC